jgi:cell wall-associated NlpC family hydrolase
MLLRLFPFALVACLALGITFITAQAQNADLRPRQIKQIEEVNDPEYSEDDPIVISVAANTAPAEARENRIASLRTVSPLLPFQPLLLNAIDARLGSPYRWGSTGPNAFDCSGFVWSAFHTAGIDFERGSARTLWSRFEAPAPEEQFKFGTLVFFNGQKHVGIVVDENGFYHASRHHGVVYAEFKGYWGKHVDGFRRVPVVAQLHQQQRAED